jgi:acetoacetyl-CoA reductase/3-oxoacyl-[acyl-carrier protein] reductase
MNTAGRVAVVTGGTRGLGAAVSARLVADGMTVTAVYRSDDAAAERLLAQLDGSGRVTIRQADVADPDQCHDVIAGVLATHGRIDVLVNNAGTLVERELADITPPMWDQCLRVNLSSAFHLTQAAVGPMRQAGFGRIVNIGSVTAAMGSPFQIDYAAAKAGLVGLTRSLARTVARSGITVNCVIPGGFETEMLDALTRTNAAAIARGVPVGRFGQPHELAHVVAMLAHDDASYVNGAVVVVDGGLSMGQ